MNAPAPRRLVALLALAGALLAALPAGAAPAAEVSAAVSTEAGRLAVRHEKFTLPNGFEVILVEDHRLPLVAFNLWVHAGPRNEAPGQTGFAHLFEHLMFAGSRHVPRGGFDKFIDAAGGSDSNGSTNFDRTNYFFTLPSNQLALGLWLKADMLGWMIDEVDSVALANQQDVVRNERRQSFENQPYGIVEEAMYQALPTTRRWCWRATSTPARPRPWCASTSAASRPAPSRPRSTWPCPRSRRSGAWSSPTASS
jgi:zinc protease